MSNLNPTRPAESGTPAVDTTLATVGTGAHLVAWLFYLAVAGLMVQTAMSVAAGQPVAEMSVLTQVGLAAIAGLIYGGSCVLWAMADHRLGIRIPSLIAMVLPTLAVGLLLACFYYLGLSIQTRKMTDAEFAWFASIGASLLGCGGMAAGTIALRQLAFQTGREHLPPLTYLLLASWVVLALVGAVYLNAVQRIAFDLKDQRTLLTYLISGLFALNTLVTLVITYQIYQSLRENAPT